MDSYRENSENARSRSNPRELGLWLFGIVAVFLVAAALKHEAGIPLATTLRVAGASICLFLIYRLGTYFPGERWPRIGLCIALIVNIGIFFTPLVHRPISRGELMLFAVPDAIVVLATMLIERIITHPVTDAHQRAVRQQLILGLLLAIAFGAILFTLMLIDPRAGLLRTR